LVNFHQDLNSSNFKHNGRKKEKTRIYQKKPGEILWEVFLSKKLGIDRRKFHREIKPIIISDFPEIIEELGCENPDIGLDYLNNLYLGNIDHTIIKSTGLTIFDYI